MIGVGFRKNGRITLEASYNNTELETAVALGESLARHNKGEVVVFLYSRGRTTVKVLKRMRKGLVRTGFLGLRLRREVVTK